MRFFMIPLSTNSINVDYIIINIESYLNYVYKLLKAAITHSHKSCDDLIHKLSL